MGSETRVNIRVEPELRKDFDHALELTGMGETQFIKAALKAFIEYVREHGEITVPLALLPRSAVRAAPKPAALPAQKPRRPDAPIALPENPSTDSTRFSVNEEETARTAESAPPSPKKSALPFVPRSAGSRAAAKRLAQPETRDPKRHK